MAMLCPHRNVRVNGLPAGVRTYLLRIVTRSGARERVLIPPRSGALFVLSFQEVRMRSSWQPEGDGCTSNGTRNSARHNSARGAFPFEGDGFGYGINGGSYRFRLQTDNSDPSLFNFEVLLVDVRGRK